jgi:hypothetical protein
VEFELRTDYSQGSKKETIIHGKKGDIVQNIIQVYQPNKYSGHSPGSN